MPDRQTDPARVRFAPAPDAAWTLHHVLLDHLESDSSTAHAVAEEPPPEPVRRAFETLDAGGHHYSVEELEAVRTVLASYHHSPTWWEVERPRLERLLHLVSERLDAGPTVSG